MKIAFKYEFSENQLIANLNVRLEVIFFVKESVVVALILKYSFDE